MIKWFKKHCKKLIIASSILTACICGLFGFTKTFAYTNYDSSGAIIGNDVLNNATNINYINHININGDNNYLSYYDGNTYDNYDIGFLTRSMKTDYCGFDLTFDITKENTPIASNRYFWISTYFDITSFLSVNDYYTFAILVDATDFYSDSDVQTVAYSYGFLKDSALLNRDNNDYWRTFSYLNFTQRNYSLGNYYFGKYLSCITINKDNNFLNNCPYFGLALRLSNYSYNKYGGVLKVRIMAFKDSTINLNNSFSNNTIYYPYSSIAQLQQDYDTLQQQYNEYVATHSYSNTQYNDLVSANSSLQQQISALRLQYDVYVASHSHTNEEYNELRERLSNLQENYSDLHDELLELQNDYEDLQNAYNTMKTNYDTLNNAINYGIYAYIDGYNYGDVLEAGVFFFGSYNGSTYYIMPPSGNDYIWSFNDLIEEGLLENGGILRIDKITGRSDYNSNVNYSCQIRLNHMPITSFYLDVQNMNGAYIQVRDYSSTQRVVSFTTNSNEHVFTYQNIYSVDTQFNNEISDIIITSQFSSSSILGQAIGATASIQSYNNGYNDGVNFMSYYKNEYDVISREYESARRDIVTLRELNESLNEQISSNLGWKSLFFAMADTPLKTVSNVLGFELFGVNLFTTFIGMLTVLGIVFLLKKLI